MRSTKNYRTGAVLVLLASLTAVAACGGSGAEEEGGAGEVVVYDGGGPWGEAQRKAYFEPFEEETGIRVIPAPQPDAAQVRTETEAGRPSVDVMNNDGSRLEAWNKAGLIEPIDYSAWPDGMQDDFDPYPTRPEAVPSLIFAVKIAFDESATQGAMTSWTDFWDTERFPGPRSLGDTASSLAAGTMEAALLADGVAPEELYPLDIDRAFNKLDELRPDIVKFWGSGAESVQLLIDGQVSAVAAWDGRINDAVDNGAEIQSTWDEAILQVNYWMIPKGAENAENAQKFIEFASRPDRQAEFSELVTYSPANIEAFDMLSEERQEVLSTAPAHLENAIVVNNDWWNSEAPSGDAWNVEIINRWQAWLAGR
ncbi:ABC transporter substrate-binding protein [Ornithinimicrobium sufpigmenti]|uniref:ABC transporter substrate-binding protein n=1 Tax=Ornithinimicrobium sufpigmenti TaxID=2508882 RepID=UPI00103579F4|nr:MULTISPECIES: ABC transporter substrate-binding protein [unclassified Ornithinimicrobium]